SVLLIGDPAITFRQQNPPHQLWDLGQAWQELTGLPFVYAVWAIRESQAKRDLLKKLWDAKQLGMKQLETLVAKDPRFDLSFRKSYDLGEKEKKGITTFVDQLRNLVDGPIFDPRFVQASTHGDR
ncbi:MAG: MqnA/MqnD/SBP family protein, partial [Verrucomicrobiales bacterium]